MRNETENITPGALILRSDLVAVVARGGSERAVDDLGSVSDGDGGLHFSRCNKAIDGIRQRQHKAKKGRSEREPCDCRTASHSATPCGPPAAAVAALRQHITNESPESSASAAKMTTAGNLTAPAGVGQPWLGSAPGGTHSAPWRPGPFSQTQDCPGFFRLNCCHRLEFGWPVRLLPLSFAVGTPQPFSLSSPSPPIKVYHLFYPHCLHPINQYRTASGTKKILSAYNVYSNLRKRRSGRVRRESQKRTEGGQSLPEGRLRTGPEC